uniref:Uncharacterized protein n=1 Tax=viral metagenome TaxID=1070528 RepID=A0A6M3JJP9_9ZZZZ
MSDCDAVFLFGSGGWAAFNAHLRAALAQPESERPVADEPTWCYIHQHHKWCEHNGGVMGPTGYEAPICAAPAQPEGER